MILGDSLLVMTSLVEKEGLKGKVQTIYIDPPYGIKFGSNWQVSTRKRDVKDGRAEDAKERIERAEMSEARANRIETELCRPSRRPSPPWSGKKRRSASRCSCRKPISTMPTAVGILRRRLFLQRSADSVRSVSVDHLVGDVADGWRRAAGRRERFGVS